MRSPSNAFAPAIDPATYRLHALHAQTRDWPQTNCYADLWIEATAARGAEPRAMFGFCVALDFEGDQFTFFKPSFDEIERLYGLGVFELSIYDRLVDHIAAQCALGRLPMVEVDAFYLPDTRGISYGLEHTKTTIGVNAIDITARRADFFHNEGYFSVDGDEFDRVFQAGVTGEALPPYAEFVKPLRPALGEAQAREFARQALARHLDRAPTRSPIAAFADALPALLGRARAKDPTFFHKLAFNTVRQLGANFELLAAHLDWLDAEAHAAAIEAARRLSANAKAFQFVLARAMMRDKPIDAPSAVATLANAYADLFAALGRARLMERAS